MVTSTWTSGPEAGGCPIVSAGGCGRAVGVVPHLRQARGVEEAAVYARCETCQREGEEGDSSGREHVRSGGGQLRALWPFGVGSRT